MPTRWHMRAPPATSIPCRSPAPTMSASSCSARGIRATLSTTRIAPCVVADRPRGARAGGHGARSARTARGGHPRVERPSPGGRGTRYCWADSATRTRGRGEPARARALAAEIATACAAGTGSWVHLAYVHAGLGEPDAGDRSARTGTRGQGRRRPLPRRPPPCLRRCGRIRRSRHFGCAPCARRRTKSPRGPTKFLAGRTWNR